MANKRHPKLLTQWQIIKLCRQGVYRVDTKVGIVYGRNGQPLKSFPYDEKGYLGVRLYNIPGCRCIALHRLVWMVAVGRPIPKDFEVHHKDNDVGNNRYENLFCIHWLDHRKLHGGWMAEEDKTPF